MIELQNLRFSYGNTPLIEDLSLSLANGTFTALIGENGSGKSTLLKLLTGNEKPSSGKILLDGKDIRTLRKTEAARRLSYFPQSRPIPDMTALAVVSMGRYPYTRGAFSIPKADRERALSAMEKTGSAHFAERNMKTLSFGERQKVYLAMQLAQDTPNCLLDEPTNFMDISAKFSMLAMLREMKSEGRCVLCVLHDIALAMQYADRIVVMKNGKILADGTPAALYRSGAIENAFGVRLKQYENAYILLPNR